LIQFELRKKEKEKKYDKEEKINERDYLKGFIYG